MKKTKLGLLVLAPILLIVLSSKFIHGPFNNLTSSFSFEFKSSNLQKIVQKNLAGKKGEYAVYIQELGSRSKEPGNEDDAEVYSLNSSNVFPAASLYKVYLLAAVLKEIEDGRLRMEDGVSASKVRLIEILGEDEFEIQDLPSILELTVDEALTRVGRISDNFSAIMLAEAVGWEKIQFMADSLGAKNTRVYPPSGGLIETSVEDMALFFKKLYRKEIVSPSISEQIINYLSLNQINDRIPALLPSPEVPEHPQIIHKTGELPGVRHDAGIVYLASKGETFRAYIIVLLSKDLEFEDEGVETLAQISKQVYEYFKNKFK